MTIYSLSYKTERREVKNNRQYKEAHIEIMCDMSNLRQHWLFQLSGLLKHITLMGI